MLYSFISILPCVFSPSQGQHVDAIDAFKRPTEQIKRLKYLGLICVTNKLKK